MRRNTFSATIVTSKHGSIELEFPITTPEPTFTTTQVDALYGIARKLTTFDKYQKTYGRKRDQAKTFLTGIAGPKVSSITLTKLRRRIRIFFSRYTYNLEKLREKLGPENKDIYEASVSLGTAFRVVLPADHESRRRVIDGFVELVEGMGGEVTPFAKSQLEPLVREKVLQQMCATRRINLLGVREPVHNYVIEELPKPKKTPKGK